MYCIKVTLYVLILCQEPEKYNFILYFLSFDPLCPTFLPLLSTLLPVALSQPLPISCSFFLAPSFSLISVPCRYFVLDPEVGQLQYYLNELSKSQQPPRGSLPLLGAMVVSSDEFPYMFTIQSTTGVSYKLKGKSVFINYYENTCLMKSRGQILYNYVHCEKLNVNWIFFCITNVAVSQRLSNHRCEEFA